jgi:hypothetical protein
MGETTGGWRWNSALSLSIQSSRARGARTLPQWRAAATLRHIVPGKSPHLSPVHADTLRWLGHWWLESSGKWNREPFSWRVWHRGGWQGQSALGEWGASLGRELGQSSRFTNSRVAHVAECGILMRTEGTWHAVLGWSRGGMQFRIGPGWTWGQLWRPPPGWTVAFTWRPDFDSGLSLHR